MQYLLAIWIVVLGLTAPGASAAAEPVEGAGLVYIIPIRGTIESALTYVIRRGILEAHKEGAEAILFVMDTPGGELGAASEIIRMLQRVQVPTYTFVEKDAFSAGAMIALATRQIYMAPGSVIGAATPMLMSPLGGAPQQMPGDIEEKMKSAVSALIRAAAEESGHDPQLAEKMVRRETEYRVGDDFISPTNQLLTLTNLEAERRIRPGGKPLLSEGTVKNVDELLTRIGKAGAIRKELAVSGAEQVARFIKDPVVTMILLAAGLLGIYIEIKSPGFGLPGILGGVALAFFFWGQHIAGLAGMEELALFFIGLILVLVEIFIFPTIGALAIVGSALMLWSLLTAMVQHLPGDPLLPRLDDLTGPMTQLAAALVLTAVAAPLIGRFLPKTPAFRWLALAKTTSAAEGFTAAAPRGHLVGRTGVARSPLRPAGAADFEGQRLDVITRGEFLAADTPIRVVETHGSRIIVEALEAGPHQAESKSA